MPKEIKKGPGRPPVAKSIKEYLSSPATKKLFEEGKAQVNEGGGGFAEYDDGKYRAQVVSATAGRSQNGRWQNVTVFKFLEGEYKGQSCYQYQGLENPMGYTMLISQFSKLGVEVDGPEDLESANKEVTKSKPIVEIRLRTKGEFQNILVLKAVDAESAEEETEENDDDVDTDEDEKDEDVETSEDEDSDDEADEETEDEDESENDEEEDEKPAKKTSKKAAPKDEEDDEESEDEDESESEDEDEKDEEPEEEKVTLDVGTKVKIKYEGENLVGKIVKVDEEKSRIKVKLKNGDKVWVTVPDQVVDVL